MQKKVIHIFLSLILLVSTIGMTFTKHYCNAQLTVDIHEVKIENTKHSHKHQSQEKEHGDVHRHGHNDAKATSSHSEHEKSCTDISCCESNSCHEDNCCHNETTIINLLQDFVKVEYKDVSKTFEIKLFLTELSNFDVFQVQSNFNLILIADAPHKIKNSQSILQIFRC